tara:strand:- start:18 stop:476 length:459 start_codon:yes stop_codon:yes gene_type:complete
MKGEIKDPTFNIYRNGGNVERRGNEINKEQLEELASRSRLYAELKKDPDAGLTLELIQEIKRLRDEMDPNEKDLNKFLDKLSDEEIKRIKLKDGSNVVDLRAYSKSKEPKVKKINLASLFEDTARTVASLSPTERAAVNDLLKLTLKNMKGE